MSRSVSLNAALAVVAAGLASVCGCSSQSDSGYHFPVRPWPAPPEQRQGAPGAAGSMGTAGAIDSTAAVEIVQTVPTPGCGQDPGQALGTAVRGTVQTMGTKPADAADSKKGDWSYEREYFVTLPVGYDNNKAYPLVLEGTGCGGTGMNVIELTDPTTGNTLRADPKSYVAC